MKGSKLDGVKLTQLRALVTVAERGNFSEAALQLEVSQSAVSHAIAALETQLGVVLLSRGRHGATLTPVGERITHHAKDMLRLLDTIGKEANLAKGLEGGEIRIASFRSVATHVLPELIASFRQCFPGITVTIHEYRGDDGVEQALREGHADIGFSCMPVSEEFEAWELFRDEYFVLVPPIWERGSKPMSWEELTAYPLILPPGNDYCSLIIHNHFASQAQSIKAAYVIQEDSTIVGMVKRGLGVTIMARLAAEPLPPEIQMYRLPVPLERTIRVVMLANSLHSPAVFAFLDMLKDAYQTPELKVS